MNMFSYLSLFAITKYLANTEQLSSFPLIKVVAKHMEMGIKMKNLIKYDQYDLILFLDI